MLIHPNKKIELKNVTSIQLIMDRYDDYSIMNILKSRFNLNRYYKIPFTSKLHDLLDTLVRQLVVDALDHRWENLRNDASNKYLDEIMERHFDQLFEHPNADVTLIEERVNHRLRSEIAEAARGFLLNIHHCLPEQERENFFNQFIDNHVIHVYFKPDEERFRFSFPNESELREDDDTFYCGYIALEEQDTQNIFN